jgi:hypothetical protein
MGANLALAYGTRRNGLAGILMIAPGHRPELRGWAQRNGTVARQARAALARGQGSRRFTVSDYNQGGFREFTLPAQVAVDFFAPDGPTVMPLNAPRLRRGTALMWIIGEGDRLAALGRGYVFDAVPPNPKNLYVVVSGGHRATPRIGQREIVAWLRGL